MKKLAEFVGREIEVWTMENTEPWMGILKEVGPDLVTLLIDELETYIVAFRLSEGEQEASTEGGGGEEA